MRYLAYRDPQRYPLLLDSAAAGVLGRHSILLACRGAALWQDNAGGLHARGRALGRSGGGGFLTALEEAWRTSQVPARPADGLPFVGGWALYLGYEMAQEIEPGLALPPGPLPWRAFALRTPCALIHDIQRQRLLAVAEPGAEDFLAQVLADVATVTAAGIPALPHILAVTEESPQAYLERVLRAKEYVAAGDVYQANLSRPWQVQFAGDSVPAAPIYERLRAANPAPFAALAQWEGTAILSSSPERLVRVNGRQVDTRPIAGTRPRSREPGRDAAEMSALAAHPKERAEHIMLIDLERNDLGRVCEAGTVRVDELMTIESYTHVHHIVSNVSGILRPQVSPVAAVRAVFPGGTITGCPKYRCMQIIAELEGEGRGAYTGALGYLGCDGRLDLNILIRTLTLCGPRLTLRAGAGIVADSDPARELNETRAKARGLLAALGVTP
ncbi:MAG: aminodeoxychorismate synthase component I [Proteobacteria bacterium]|nr:aminodeoxychorismate synthase component I [Pseudomonadota bacterium]